MRLYSDWTMGWRLEYVWGCGGKGCVEYMGVVGVRGEGRWCIVECEVFSWLCYVYSSVNGATPYVHHSRVCICVLHVWMEYFRQTYIHTYIHTYICTNVHTHTYTHTHTHQTLHWVCFPLLLTWHWKNYPILIELVTKRQPKYDTHYSICT